MYFPSFLRGLKSATAKIFSTLAILGLLFISVPSVSLAAGSSTPGTTATTTIASTENTSNSPAITTGDATSGSQISNDANNSVTSVTESDATTTASSTNKNDASLVPSSASSTPSDKNVNVRATSTLTSTSTATTTATTGVNNASTTATTTATTTISTGDATAYLDILNNVGNSLINSDGVISLLSGDNVSGNIDLQLDGLEDGILSKQLSELSLQSMKDAKITNKAVVIAETGKNDVCAPNGKGSISTGNAKAGANVVNFANNTFIDSKYAIVSTNILGNFLGDLILPGKSFFEKVGDLLVQNLDAHISNIGSATTTAKTSTQTGGNTTGGSVVTGTGQSASDIQNQSGTLGIGGDPFVNLTFNIEGGWNGNIYSLPKGITYTKTDTGFILSNDASEAEGATTSSTHESSFANANISSTSTTNISNDISVQAGTGENISCGDTNIQTGDALSSLVVLNLFNMTFYGKNFLYGAVNIFGNWKGDIAFGEPDLAVLGRADVDVTKKGAYPGTTVTYTYTIANNGGADATNVTFTDTMGNYLALHNAEGGASHGKKVTWNLGTIEAGQAKQVSYTVNVNDDIPYGTTYVENDSIATATEPDANLSNNSEAVSIPLYREHPHSHGGGNSGSSDQTSATSTTGAPILKLSKTNDTTGAIAPSSTVNYTIVIDNNGGPAYRSVLYDVLRDADGDIISTQNWNLDTIKPSEEITLHYTVLYNDQSLSGTYTNTAQIVYYLSNDPTDAAQFSQTATSDVVVEGQDTTLDKEALNATAFNDKNGTGTPSTLSDDPDEGATNIFIPSAHAAGNDTNNLASAADAGFNPNWLLVISGILLFPLLYLFYRYRKEERGEITS